MSARSTESPNNEPHDDELFEESSVVVPTGRVRMDCRPCGCSLDYHLSDCPIITPPSYYDYEVTWEDN